MHALHTNPRRDTAAEGRERLGEGMERVGEQGRETVWARLGRESERVGVGRERGREILGLGSEAVADAGTHTGILIVRGRFL